MSEEKRRNAIEAARECNKQYIQEKDKKKKTTDELIKKLHHKLVQTCIDFIRENEIGDLEAVDFTVDELQFSAKYGEWTPATDSFLTCYEKVLDDFMLVRKEIGISY